MADSDDPRAQWLSALGAIVVVAAVIGSVLGGLTYGAVRLTGLAGGDTQGHRSPSSRPEAAAALAAARPAETHTASRAGATADQKSADQAGHDRAAKARTHHSSPRAAHPSHHKPRHHAKHAAKHHRKHAAKHRRHHQRRHPTSRTLTLAASRHHVHRMGRVNLSGHYRGRSGTRLVVQRLEGGRWQRFPVSVTVRGGRFRTWVASGYPGRNRFRVVDPGAHRASAPVTVVVH